MALTGGMSCVKYLLFVFNLFFVVTGLILLIAGVNAEIKARPYIDLTDEAFYTSVPVLMIMIGIVVFIVAFLGCCGAVKENHCMIVTFSAFLLLIFLAELGVGIAGYMKRGDLQDSILRHLNQSIAEFPTNKEVQNSFNILQTDLHCCGINSPADWATNKIPIPDTCCFGQEINAGAPVPCSETNPNFHSEGCLPKLVELFRGISVWIGGVGLIIALVQLLGVILACCLARSIRSQYETV